MGTLLEHKETLLWVLISLNLCMTAVIALSWSKSAARRELRSIRLQIQRLEELQEDLSERFSKKQSRDAMRAARATKEEERTLQEQAQTIVAAQSAGAGAASSQAADKKTALRMKLRGN